MKFVCDECKKLISEKEVIFISEYHGQASTLIPYCEGCYKEVGGSK